MCLRVGQTGHYREFALRLASGRVSAVWDTALRSCMHHLLNRECFGDIVRIARIDHIVHIGCIAHTGWASEVVDKGERIQQWNMHYRLRDWGIALLRLMNNTESADCKRRRRGPIEVSEGVAAAQRDTAVGHKGLLMSHRVDQANESEADYDKRFAMGKQK